jgi:hypothetical protein
LAVVPPVYHTESHPHYTVTAYGLDCFAHLKLKKGIGNVLCLDCTHGSTHNDSAKLHTATKISVIAAFSTKTLPTALIINANDIKIMSVIMATMHNDVANLIIFSFMIYDFLPIRSGISEHGAVQCSTPYFDSVFAVYLFRAHFFQSVLNPPAMAL